MKITDNFDIREFVHPAFWEEGERRNDPHFVRMFVSDFQINYAVLMREILGAPVVINNWHLKGKRPYIGRGTRPATYRPTGGAAFSQHYLAKAVDLSSPDYTIPQIFTAIMDNADRFKKVGLTTIENIKATPGWLHGDCRPVWMEPKEKFNIIMP